MNDEKQPEASDAFVCKDLKEAMRRHALMDDDQGIGYIAYRVETSVADPVVILAKTSTKATAAYVEHVALKVTRVPAAERKVAVREIMREQGG